MCSNKNITYPYVAPKGFEQLVNQWLTDKKDITILGVDVHEKGRDISGIPYLNSPVRVTFNDRISTTSDRRKMSGIPDLNSPARISTNSIISITSDSKSEATFCKKLETDSWYKKSFPAHRLRKYQIELQVPAHITRAPTSVCGSPKNATSAQSATFNNNTEIKVEHINMVKS